MTIGLAPRRRRSQHTHLSCGERLEPRALLAGLSGSVPFPIPMPVGGVSDTAFVAPLVFQAPSTGPTAHAPSSGFQVMPLVLGSGDGVTILPAVERGNGGWQVVAVAGGTDQSDSAYVPEVEPWEPGGLLPEWEYRVYQEEGVLPPDDRRAVEDPQVGSSDLDSEPWPLDPRTGHLRAFGQRFEGGDAKEAFGQVPGRVNGVLADVGGIVVTEGAPVLAGFWWFARRGGNAIDAIAEAAAAGGKSGTAAAKPLGYTRMQDYIRELGVPALPSTTPLTPQQVFALQENLQAVISNSLAGYRELIGRGVPRAQVLQGPQSQLNQLRWRFIDQVPGGREAIKGILREFPEVTFPY